MKFNELIHIVTNSTTPTPIKELIKKLPMSELVAKT